MGVEVNEDCHTVAVSVATCRLVGWGKVFTELGVEVMRTVSHSSRSGGSEQRGLQDMSGLSL